MLLDLTNSSEDIKLYYMLSGYSFAMYAANKEKNKYMEFTSGNGKWDNTDIESFFILTLLTKLGFSLNELGTYFFKDIIIEAKRKIKNGMSFDELRCELSDKYSSFYLNLATEDLDLGVSSFHTCLNKSINERNKDMIDKELVYDIFGDEEIKTYYEYILKTCEYTLNCYEHIKIKK